MSGPTPNITLRFADLGWPVVCPIISRLTHHWSNHVDILTDDGRMISALPGGVREWGKAELAIVREEIVAIPCSAEHRAATLSFALGQIGKDYDYLGVVAFKWAPPWNDSRRWFCSELAAAALAHGGLITVPKGTHRISPGGLMGLVSSGVAALA